MAEGVGFEPTEPFGSPVFKTGAIDHSTTPPLRCAAGDMPGMIAGFKKNHDVSSPETPLSKWNNEHDKGMVRKIELQILYKNDQTTLICKRIYGQMY